MWRHASGLSKVQNSWIIADLVGGPQKQSFLNYSNAVIKNKKIKIYNQINLDCNTDMCKVSTLASAI